jgi:Uma2 family endonuclease
MPPTNAAERIALDQMENIGDLLEQLGGISPRRVRLHPAPGTATEQDLLDINDHTGVICELVDGVLVEKDMGLHEAGLAMWLGHLLQNFLDQHDLGFLAGADGPFRLLPRLVRLPDVSFILWEKLPGHHLPAEPIPDLAPDLALEVLSKGNTRGEMNRQLREYFLAGTQLVWLVRPDRRTVTVHTSPDESTVFTEADTLDGGQVLPGLSLPVRRIFERLPRTASAASKKPPRKRKNGKNP